MSATAYDYRISQVLRVVDGDTVDLRLDLGFYMSSALRFRLLDIDTPERGQPFYAECNEFTRAWLAARPDLRAATLKADSFGRWLAHVYDPSSGDSLSRDLLAYMQGVGLDGHYR